MTMAEEFLKYYKSYYDQMVEFCKQGEHGEAQYTLLLRALWEYAWGIDEDPSYPDMDPSTRITFLGMKGQVKANADGKKNGRKGGLKSGETRRGKSRRKPVANPAANPPATSPRTTSRTNNNYNNNYYKGKETPPLGAVSPTHGPEANTDADTPAPSPALTPEEIDRITGIDSTTGEPIDGDE